MTEERSKRRRCSKILPLAFILKCIIGGTYKEYQLSTGNRNLKGFP